MQKINNIKKNETIKMRCPSCKVLYEYKGMDLSEILEKYGWVPIFKNKREGTYYCPNCNPKKETTSK